jgi:fatty-acyl-CoA synthase
VLAQNTTDALEVQFACGRLGAIFVPLNWRLSDAELRTIVADCSPAALFHGAEFVHRSISLATHCGIRHTCMLGGADTPYQTAISRASRLEDPANMTHDDPWNIFYTSGTTGLPKGAIITYGAALWHTVNATGVTRISHESVYLCVLPLFHAGAMYFLTNPILHAGGCVIVMRTFDPGSALSHIGNPALGITHLFAVPTPYLFMAQHGDFARTDFSHVRFAGVGGAPAPLSLLQAWEKQGVPLSQGYAMTETLYVTALDSEDAQRKVGSAGKPVLHAAVRVVDADGTDVATGETGEIWVKGPSVTSGYWNQQETTRAAFQDGWFRSGDAARIDNEGYYYIVDRWKDMYISGGENVYPAEIENVIHQMEAVAEAAVIGVPDERWGEVGRAIVVLKRGCELSDAALLAHCADRLSHYKLPRSVIFVDELPHNATGKLHKPTLRRLYGGGVSLPP